MNIGYLYGFNSYPPRGGGSIHVYHLTQNLRRLGHEIHTLGSEANPECANYSATSEGIRQFLNNIDLLYVRIDGSFLLETQIKRHCMDQIGSKPIVWEINAAAEERLSKFKCQPLGNHLPPDGTPWRNLGRKIRWKRQEILTYLNTRKDERCRRQYAKRVAAAICVSAALRDYAVSGLGIQECEVIPNGSDPSLFTPERRDGCLFNQYTDYFKVIFSGDARWPWQRFDLLQQLAARASQRGDRILFIVLTGTQTDLPGAGRNMVVLSQIDYYKVPAYLASADACLLVYDDFSWSKYGFHGSPTKLFDYMASGRPVIASRIGQISVVIEDGKDGLLARNDVDDIYDKILFCLEHRAQAECMGRAAREKVMRLYNWERVARVTSHIFGSVLRRQGRIAVHA